MFKHEYYMLIQVKDGKYIELFLEALPIVTFWLQIVVAQSQLRGQLKQVSCHNCCSMHEHVVTVTVTCRLTAIQLVLVSTTPHC